MKVFKEIKVDLCANHKDTAILKDIYPNYVFNPVIIFPARECRIAGCLRDAYYTAIGIQIPDVVGEIKRPEDEQLCRATYEIFREAKEMLDGGPALEKLIYYIESRVIPSEHRRPLAKKMIGHHARLVLSNLNIDPACTLSDKDKHRILRYLELYPEDYE